ncbi:hypothetical protein [Carnobacterium maltaromaticum]|nr:conserved hypothetical protein [Carnobacterium maltaromaticum]
MSKNYEKWLDRYMINWCTEDQLKRLVALKQITEAELQLILKAKEDKEAA